MWKRLVLKANLLFNYHRERNRVALLLGEQALKVPSDQPETEGFQLIETLPEFTRVLPFQRQQFVVGKSRPPGEGKIDAQKFTHDPLICQHPSDRLAARGGKDKWWTCLACGNRFDRIPLSEFEPTQGAPVSDKDLITFGTHMGHTYQHVWNKHQGYCQWVLQTAEMGDSSTPLRRFATYIAQMEQRMGFQSIPAGRFDEAL